jgi:hypothetical protein
MVFTTKVVKFKMPENGETSGTAGTYSKAVNDAIGAATVDAIASCPFGRYVITTIVIH